MAHDHDQTFSVPFPDHILDSPYHRAQTAVTSPRYSLSREEMGEFFVNSHRRRRGIEKGTARTNHR
jgi:hypothetical protein